jgi:hypothetical protein
MKLRLTLFLSVSSLSAQPIRRASLVAETHLRPSVRLKAGHGESVSGKQLPGMKRRLGRFPVLDGAVLAARGLEFGRMPQKGAAIRQEDRKRGTMNNALP